MQYKDNPVFPKDFLWGASSSSWQVEGAIEEDGKTLSLMDLNTRTKKPFADNSVASDHYHHYKEDVRLMKEAGFTSYRFSISWPRIYPDSSGVPNQKGLDFYDSLINELVDAGISPVVTLYHYDMPIWVVEEFGGWYGRDVIEHFDKYVRTVLSAYGDRVKHWIALNEQNMQVCYAEWFNTVQKPETWFEDKWKVNHIMNLCSAKAVIACHELVEGAIIGPAPGMVPIYPASSAPMDQIAAMNAEEMSEKVWNDVNIHGKYSNFIKRYWKENDIDPGIEPGDEELLLAGKCDYIAVNCYRSNVGAWASKEESAQAYELNETGEKGQLSFPVVPGMYKLVENPHVETNDWDWEIDPVAMRYVLRYLWDMYQVPLLITENGLGFHEDLDENGEVNDDYRVDFLRKNIYQVGLAIEDGAQVIGYNPWSFTDLLSTGNGMAKRYGLVFINRTDDDLRDLRRVPKKSYYWYSDLIKSNGVNWGE